MKTSTVIRNLSAMALHCGLCTAVVTLATGALAQQALVEVVVSFEAGEIDREPLIVNGAIAVTSQSKTTTVASLATALACTHVVQDRLSPRFSYDGPWLIALYTEQDPQVLLAQIRSESAVRSAELNAVPGGVEAEIVQARFPDPSRDLFCLSQPQLHRRVSGEGVLSGSNCSQVNSGADRDMDLPQAWAISEGDTNVVVAVIDIGFDLVHPGLGGPGPEVAVDDSLLYYNSGVWFRNWRELPGEADAATDTLHRPGAPGVDDDNNGYIDEDCWGILPDNVREPDVSYGHCDTIGALTITDLSANWRDDELKGLLFCLAMPPLFESEFAVPIEHNTQNTIITSDLILTVAGPGGWSTIATTLKREYYKIGDGADTDMDGRQDDLGYIGCPGDDDENGYEDDFRGWDFVDYRDSSPGGLCPNEDYYDQDNDPTGLHDHGTSVASQIASAPVTGRMMGVAPKVKILPLRIGVTVACGEQEDGGRRSPAAFGQALAYAMDMGVDVISLSLGSGSCPPPELIREAADKGIIVVWAAGNEVTDVGCFNVLQDEVVWVGGLGPQDARWQGGELGESNYGTWVDISARAHGLAVAVWGVDRREVAGHPELPWVSWMPANEWHGYAYAPLDGTHAGGAQSGTSLAAPAVAGVMALVKSRYPHWTAQEVINKVIGSTDNIYGPGMVEDRLAEPMGSGRVNAYKALTFYGTVAALSDTIWTGELWVGGDVLIPSGRQLAIAAGTIVNVAVDDLLEAGGDPNAIEFVVDGTLEINGEPGRPVLFRLFEDGGATTEYAVNATVSGSTFTMSSLPAQAADRARYPIAAASTDSTTVFAVEIVAAAAVDSVSVNLYDMGGPASLPLRDDGAGEDAKAGDGIYTSDRCQVNVSAGDHVASVRTWVSGGAVADQDVVVEAVANKAKFIDVSAETGALYALAPQDTTATPYTAVYFAAAPLDSISADLLLVTIDDDATQPLFLRRITVESGVPQYADARFSLLDTEIPMSSRGVAFSDFDNDGDNDFFVCGLDSAVLYENRLDEIEGQFVNVTAAAFGAARSQLAGSLAASWGDYNRDGFLDLVVTTTDYDGPMRLLADPGSYNCETLVFRNKRNGSFEMTGFGDSTSGNVIPASCWVDLDRDGDPELVLGRMVGEYPIVLDNTGYSTGAGDAQLVAGNWATTGVVSGANSVSVIDYDHDPYPDLLVTEVAAPGRAVILQNNYDGSPGSKSFTPIELAASGSWTGAVVADFDLTGQEDYLLLPRVGDPALYMADAYGTSPTYRDLAYTLGLRSGGVGGAIAGDFNNDHDPDLYLGRLKTDQFQYKNVRQNLTGGDDPAAEQKWLAVQLGTSGSSNGGLIGTEVSVTAGGQRWTQHVDGGSGRGGQRPGRLLFGLGNIAQNQVTVVARFPSGERDSVSSVDVNTQITLEENEAVALKAGTKNDPEPDFDFELQPGSMNWVFKWRSTNVRGDLRRDVVHVQNFHSYPLNSACSIGIDEGDTLDLHWGDPGVGHLVYWDGSLWQHEVRWGGLLCYPGCEHRFSVTSATSAADSVLSSLRVTTPTTLCLPDMEQ